MAALQRAVALAEMDGAAAAVAEHLDFDVARLLQVLFQIDRGVAERRFGLVGSRRQRQHQIIRGLRDLHAASAAAGGRLDQHRKADFVCDRNGVVVGTNRAVGAGHHGNAEFPGGFLGLDLVAHQADVLGLGSDEMQIVIGEDFGEARVFRQETVAGMHRVDAGDLAGREQRRHVEVAVLRRRRSDADALIGKPHMHGIGVGGGMHRNGVDPELLARAQDAQGNLAAIGYQDLVKHVFPSGRMANSEGKGAKPLRYSPFAIRYSPSYSIITSGSPNSTGWPSSTRICVTVPARGDGIWFMVFIASLISSVWPTDTLLPTSMNGLAPGSDDQYAVPTIGEGTIPGCAAISPISQH